MAEVLVVDDEVNIRRIFSHILQEAGYEVRQAASGEEALEAVAAGHPDLVFLDYRLGGMNGLETLRALRAADCDAPVIMITAYESVKDAVALIKEGAFDYLTKPLLNEEILNHAARALALSALRRRVAESDKKLDQVLGVDAFIAKGTAMAPVLELARSVAAADLTVLISGESGTGKDLLARYIHRESPRRIGPFVVVDCGAITDSLAESELFGYEKGAFTGALRRTAGKFEAAAGGTLFLDEVGNASAGLQAKLLRAIETKSFSRVGGNTPVTADVRVIAATNRDLALVEGKGEFRSDLYFRLKGVEITLPPLRERADDLPGLVDHYVRRFAEQQHRTTVPRVIAEAMAALRAYSWPGNVRELKNLLERSVLVCGDTIEARHFPREITRSPAQRPGGSGQAGSLKTLRESMQSETEKRAVKEALAACDGNRRAAARQLGIDPKTLYRLIYKYGLG
jgi:DNA-binding NtrC family response regulator